MYDIAAYSVFLQQNDYITIFARPTYSVYDSVADLYLSICLLLLANRTCDEHWTLKTDGEKCIVVSSFV